MLILGNGFHTPKLGRNDILHLVFGLIVKNRFFPAAILDFCYLRQNPTQDAWGLLGEQYIDINGHLCQLSALTPKFLPKP